MATVLRPIVNELNTVVVHLRTELRGLQTDADGAGIAITHTQTEKTKVITNNCITKLKFDNQSLSSFEKI